MRKSLVESPSPKAEMAFFGVWRGRFYEVFAHIAMMSMLSLVRAADMYARDKFESRDLIRRGRHATPPRRARGPPTHQSEFCLATHLQNIGFLISSNFQQTLVTQKDRPDTTESGSMFLFDGEPRARA